MKPKLKWITCNGIMPDLPDGTGVNIVYQYSDEDELRSDMLGLRVAEIYWGNVVCYAIEPPKPLDPVQELIEAAAQEAKFLPAFDCIDPRAIVKKEDDANRLKAAIKAVEEMNDDPHRI